MDKHGFEKNSSKRGAVRARLDELIKRCPVEICSSAEKDIPRTATYSFFCHQLTYEERGELAELLKEITGEQGVLEYDKLTFKFNGNDSTQNYAAFTYFGQEILPHPKHAPRSINLPETKALADCWREPDTPVEFNVGALSYKYNDSDRIR